MTDNPGDRWDPDILLPIVSPETFDVTVEQLEQFERKILNYSTAKKAMLVEKLKEVSVHQMAERQRRIDRASENNDLNEFADMLVESTATLENLAAVGWIDDTARDWINWKAKLLEKHRLALKTKIELLREQYEERRDLYDELISGQERKLKALQCPNSNKNSEEPNDSPEK